MIDIAIDEISKAKSQNDYDFLLNKHSDLVVIDNDLLCQRIKARIYTNICNKDGIFYVGGNKYTVTQNTVTISEVNTRSGNQVEVDSYNYMSSSKEQEIETRAAETGRWETRHIDVQYEGNDRKVFARVATILVRYGTSASGYEEAFLQVHMSGQKKSWFSWNSYSTSFLLEDFHFSTQFRSYNGNDLPLYSYGGLQDLKNFSSGVDYQNYYVTLPLPRMNGINNKFKGFGCITLRARSRGTGNCGAIYDDCNCFYGVSTWYVKQCI